MYTIKEFCELFKISRQTFNNWMAKGLVKVIKVDKAVRITEEEVERLKNGGKDDDDKI